MRTESQAFPKLTKASLYQLIAMHRNPVGRASLLEVFGADRERRITSLLSSLERGNAIKEANKGFYAVEPWADIAHAVVGPVSAEKRARLKVLNMPEDVKLDVWITRSDVYKQSLKEGDRIIVGLARGQAGTNELRARFIAHGHEAQPLNLTGAFNAVTRRFTTTNHNIKTEFKLAQDSTPTQTGTGSHLLAQLPSHFDIRNPVVSLVKDQSRDPVSGEGITWIVARNHDIAHAHPQNILDEAARLAQKPVVLDGRVDLRELDFITIDPLGAKDLDDALCARVENDGYAFYTAIADVPYILPYMNIVDCDAYERGLTHYLADNHVAHMLPSVISTDKCSLVPNQDRAAIVIKQILGWDYQLKGFEVFAAVINSHEQLSYGQFYDRLDRKDPRFMVMATIHDTRRRQGLDKSLQAFLNTSPDKYSTKSIVETAMVQTNSLAAKFLSEAGIPFLSRNFSATPAGFPQKDGSVQRAYYASFQLGHGQLGLTHYAHMSSPIRRYGDNVNIRAIHKGIGTPGLGIQDDEIAQLDIISSHLNGRRDTDHQMMQEILKYHSLARAKAMGLTP